MCTCTHTCTCVSGGEKCLILQTLFDIHDNYLRGTRDTRRQAPAAAAAAAAVVAGDQGNFITFPLSLSALSSVKDALNMNSQDALFSQELGTCYTLS